MFSIAISYTDSRGNDKVKAFTSMAATKHEALGEVFMSMTTSVMGDFVVNGWDIADDESTLIEVIKPALSNGRFIEAIKDLRAHTGWGLKESKAFVDRFRDSF